MQQKTLVAYVSAGGATETYARIVAETLRSHGHDVDLVDLKRDRAPDLSPYRNVVAGMGVRIGMVYRRGKQFLRRRDLKGKRLAVFLSGGMAIDDPEKARSKFLSPLMKKHFLNPLVCDAFPGRMPGSGGRVDDRTDPDVARRWAEDLAGRLGDTT